jgi:hypothetical protein
MRRLQRAGGLAWNARQMRAAYRSELMRASPRN